MLRVLADRSARGVLSPGEGDALRRRVEQLIAGRETWKTKAEEIERDRDQHAAVLTDVLDRFTTAPGIGYQCLTMVPEKVFGHWRSVVHHDVERPWWQQVAQAHDRVRKLEAAASEVLHICGDQGSDVQDILRAALHCTETTTDYEALHAKVDEATDTLRRVRTVVKAWSQRTLPRSEAHRLYIEVRDALAGPRPDPEQPTTEV
jgi:hypothetical protein